MPRLDRATTLAAIALVLAAVALGGTIWVLIRRPKLETYEGRLTLMSLAEMEGLHPEMKALYVKHVVDKLLAAMNKDAAAKWQARTPEQKETAERNLASLTDSLLADFRKPRSVAQGVVRSIVTGAPLPSTAKKMAQ